MFKNPHALIEGIAISALAVDATYAFIFIRGEYWEVADVLDSGGRRGIRGRLPRREHPRHRHPDRAGRPPRRRRLHLRRGDRPPRLTRGQARQPAPEAAVPRDPGPLRRPDADQQRRDADERAAHPQPAAPSGSRRMGTEESTGTKVVSVSGLRQASRQLRDRAGDPSREIIYGLAGGPDEGREVKVWFPGGSSAPVLTGDDLDIPYSFEAMADAKLDAGLRRDHRGRRHRLGPAPRAADRALLPPRVVRQVHAMSRGNQLDGQDARASRAWRSDADGPGHHLLGPGEHHRQLPLRAG